jgi:hypothetical protein
MEEEESLGGRVVKEKKERLWKMYLYGPKAWRTKQRALEEDGILKRKSCRRKGVKTMEGGFIQLKGLA